MLLGSAALLVVVKFVLAAAEVDCALLGVVLVILEDLVEETGWAAEEVTCWVLLVEFLLDGATLIVVDFVFAVAADLVALQVPALLRARDLLLPDLAANLASKP